MIVKEKFELKNYNTFRMESVADIVYFPETVDEFVELLKKIKNPKIMGAASNVLFGTLGVKEPLIFTSNLDKIKLEDDILDVECGVKSPFLANFALANSITGFEFLAQIPSYVGGNIYMNSGAHEQCISDNLISCRIFDTLKQEDRIIGKSRLHFKYRSSIFKEYPDRCAILSAKFSANKIDQNLIKERMEENFSKRELTQPSLRFPNAGSVFKNPATRSAGSYLDSSSVKGLSVGGAKVFENHANFIINFDHANSTDVVELMYEMHKRVYDKFRVRLEPEIIFLGKKTKKEEELWTKMTTK